MPKKSISLIYLLYALPCFAETTWREDGLNGKIRKYSWQAYKMENKADNWVKTEPINLSGYVIYNKQGQRIESVDSGVGPFKNDNYTKNRYYYERNRLMRRVSYSFSLNFFNFGLHTNTSSSETYYYYNAKGQKIREQNKRHGVWSDFYTEYHYDKDNHLSYTSYTRDNEKTNYVDYSNNRSTLYNYKNGKLSSVKFYCETLSRPCKTEEYNEKGLLVVQRVYGEKLIERHFEYNSHDLVAKETTVGKPNESRNYQYDFDANDNVVLERVIKGNKPLYTIEYKIDYFED